MTSAILPTKPRSASDASSQKLDSSLLEELKKKIGETASSSTSVNGSATPPPQSTPKQITIPFNGEEYIVTIHVNDIPITIADEATIEKVQNLATQLLEDAQKGNEASFKEKTIHHITDQGIYDTEGTQLYGDLTKNKTWIALKNTVLETQPKIQPKNPEDTVRIEVERKPNSIPTPPPMNDRKKALKKGQEDSGLLSSELRDALRNELKHKTERVKKRFSDVADGAKNGLSSAGAKISSAVSAIWPTGVVG